jgi:hypothetical protein
MKKRRNNEKNKHIHLNAFADSPLYPERPQHQAANL